MHTERREQQEDLDAYVAAAENLPRVLEIVSRTTVADASEQLARELDLSPRAARALLDARIDTFTPDRLNALRSR